MKQRLSKIHSSLIALDLAQETPKSTLYRRKFSFPAVLLRPFALLSILFLALACGPPEDIGLGPNLPAAVSLLSAAEQKELAELLQAGGLHETERNRFVKLAAKPDLSPAEQKELEAFDARINSALPDREKQEQLKMLRNKVAEFADPTDSSGTGGAADNAGGTPAAVNLLSSATVTVGTNNQHTIALAPSPPLIPVVVTVGTTDLTPRDYTLEVAPAPSGGLSGISISVDESGTGLKVLITGSPSATTTPVEYKVTVTGKGDYAGGTATGTVAVSIS